MSFALAATIAALVIPDSAFPYTIARYILSIVLILILPGYAFLRMVFPSISSSSRGNEINFVERIGLSLAMSIAVASLLGLFLNSLLRTLQLGPITIGLLVLILVFASAALIRENKKQNYEFFQ